jgi:hypothetical protein
MVRRGHDLLQHHRGRRGVVRGNTGFVHRVIGFGLDSVIEVSSAAAVAWQFAGHDPEAREKIALRIIA